VDFNLPDHNLIIKIDGPRHDPEEDKSRDRWFTGVRGIPILRPRWSPQIRPMVVTPKPANENAIRTSHILTLAR
jgi:hypothetical protein